MRIGLVEHMRFETFLHAGLFIHRQPFWLFLFLDQLRLVMSAYRSGFDLRVDLLDLFALFLQLFLDWCLNGLLHHRPVLEFTLNSTGLRLILFYALRGSIRRAC